MTCQAVLGKDGIPFTHAGVPLDLRQDGRGGDGVAEGVAVDNGLLGDADVERERVNQEEVRSGSELFDGQLHGEARSLVDIDAVDDSGVDGGDRPGGGALANAFGEHGAAGGIELLAVVQSANGAVRRQDDGGGEDGAEQRAAAHFIDAGDRAEPTRAHLAFDGAVAADFAVVMFGQP